MTDDVDEGEGVAGSDDKSDSEAVEDTVRVRVCELDVEEDAEDDDVNEDEGGYERDTDGVSDCEGVGVWVDVTDVDGDHVGVAEAEFVWDGEGDSIVEAEGDRDAVADIEDVGEGDGTSNSHNTWTLLVME